MNLIQRDKIKRLVQDAMHDVICAIEEDRFYPSEPEAGDAPTDDACDSATDVVCDLITALGKEYGVVDMDIISKPLSLDNICNMLTMDNCDDFDELDEIDSFSNNHGERKYRYDTTVYRHKPTGKFISVEIQKTADGEEWLSLGTVMVVTKQEKITYEWA